MKSFTLLSCVIFFISAATTTIRLSHAFQSQNSPFMGQRRFQNTFVVHDDDDSAWKSARNVPLNHPVGSQTNRISSTELQASPLSTIASSPLGALSVLAAIVVVHEAGHYLAARAFNISVAEFSVGFGPKLTGFTALGNEFNLRALPLGGFVRFPENYNVTLAESKSKLALEAFEKRRVAEGWTWREDLLNIVTFGIWDEQRRKARKEEAAAEAAAAAKASSSPFWKRLVGSSSSSRTSKTSTEEDPEDFEIDYFDYPNLLQNRPWTERAVVLSGGVIFNLLLSFLIYFGEIGPLGNGLPQPVFDNGVMVSVAPTRQGPADGMLKKGDVIVGINGKMVTMNSKTGVMAAQKQVSDVISTIRDTKDGDSVTLSVLRDGGNSPTSPKSNNVNKDKNQNNMKEDIVTIVPKRNGQASPQAIGVFLSPNYLKTETIQSDDIIKASTLAMGYLQGITTQTLEGFGSFFSSVVAGKSAPPGQGLSGPVGLIKSGTEVVSTQDATTIFLFAAALSVNLGVVNALPIPALDGGQLLFVLAEAVTGKKVDQRLQEGLTQIAVLFLLFVTASTTFSDVGRILGGK